MKFLDDLKISTKLIGGFLIIAAIVGIVAIIGYVNMGTIHLSQFNESEPISVVLKKN